LLVVHTTSLTAEGYDFGAPEAVPVKTHNQRKARDAPDRTATISAENETVTCKTGL
jgi:hypothetical protein